MRRCLRLTMLGTEHLGATPAACAGSPLLFRVSSAGCKALCWEAKHPEREARRLMRGAHNAGRLGWEGCGP